MEIEYDRLIVKLFVCIGKFWLEIYDFSLKLDRVVKLLWDVKKRIVVFENIIIVVNDMVEFRYKGK